MPSGGEHGWAPSLLCVILTIGLTLGAMLWWRGSAFLEEGNEIGQQLRTQLQRVWRELEGSSWGSVLAQQLHIAGRSLRSGLTGYVPGVVGSVLGIGGSLIVTGATAIFPRRIAATVSSRGAASSSDDLAVSWPGSCRRARRHAQALVSRAIHRYGDCRAAAWLGIFLIGLPLAMSLALLAGYSILSLMWARLPARFQQFSLPWLSLLFLRPGSLFYSFRFNCWRET